ncbi:hypothetical protein ACP275_13G044000 [Erythranthe tilingii]
MSGVWVFKNNGVMQVVENPSDGRHCDNARCSTSCKKKALVYLPTGQVVSSYTCLEQILGWERYYGVTMISSNSINALQLI